MPPRKRQQRQQNPEGSTSNNEANTNSVQQLVSMLVGALTYQVFEAVRVNEEQKTTFATFMRNAEANYWKQVNRCREGKGVVPWERVKETLFDTYFPPSAQNQTEAQFLKPNQQQMKKTSENENKASSSHSGNAQKRKWNDNVTVGNQQGSLKKKAEACSNCGKKHVGICLKGKRVCFNCGLEGHISPNCPGPRKGACFTCGSREHLARGCPKKTAGKASGSKVNSSSGKLVVTELVPLSQPTEHI